MSTDLLLALAVFSLVTSITPGPNNMMLLASGVNFGFTRTVPHILGVSLGHAFLVYCVGLGVGALLTAHPLAYTVLQIVGAAYLLYLSWRIATAGPLQSGDNPSARPLSFLGAAAFQWVNPKGVLIAVGAIGAYAPKEDYLVNIAVVAAAFGIVNLPCVSVWALFGTVLRRVLTDPRWVRVFNYGMALALAATVYPIVAGLLR
ncbi:MAG: LysE family translocator [Alphaproteobacteria bacterium]|nr:LysE family translocator [Alphaproteobacteria bacterium]